MHTERLVPNMKHTLALIIDTGGCSLSVRAVEKLNHIGSEAVSKPSASSGSETDNVRWTVQCNWSVDYYQPCVRQIKTPLKIHTERSCGAQALLDFLLQQLNVRQNVSYLQRGTGLCTCKNEGEDLSSDSHQWNNRGNKELINRIYYMFTCCITSPTVKFYWSKIQHQLTAYERPNKFLLAFENVIFSIFYFFQSTLIHSGIIYTYAFLQ